MAKNTTKSVNEPQVSDKELQDQINAMGTKFKEEKQVKVSIPKALAPKLGGTLFVGINGVALNLPVDGKEYPIPETFANHLKDYLANLA